MERRLEQNSSEDSPLYVRWSPDRSPYAIELRLELVSKILRSLEDAEFSTAEIGGVLIGSVSQHGMPVIRIDELELIPRNPEDGAIYMPNRAQLARVAEVRRSARARGMAAVGFFRSHYRAAPLRPAPADQSLMEGDSRQRPYVAMLVRAREPYTAAFFVASDGELPREPSVREFALDESEFRALPEIRAELPPEPTRPLASPPSAVRRFLFVAAAMLAILALAIIWSRVRRPAVSQWTRPSSNQVGLIINPEGQLLKIAWDYGSRGISKAHDATLTILDGSNRRDIKLGADELKLGAVVYERASSQVEVTMNLDTPGMTLPAQTVTWSQP